MPHCAKFHQNWLIGFCDNVMLFFDFSRRWTSTVLDMFRVRLDHPQMVLGVLYHCVKFGCDRCSGFHNTKVSIFGTFDWKTPTDSQQ